MSFPSVDPTTTAAWKKLDEYSRTRRVDLQHLFSEDPGRAEHLQLAWNEFLLDYSKNRIDQPVMGALLELADQVKLREAIAAQFSGEHINQTEDRAVLHTALRNFADMPDEVRTTLDKMRSFSKDVISGNWKGYTGKAITHVVNIGIGGSDLGPDMVCEALSYYKNHLDVRFVSNVDGDHVMESLKGLNRETTLFIIVSKTFTTQETLSNARTIRQWFLEQAAEQDVAQHFVAVSTNLEAVGDFGIAADNIFPMWDWVGGRFSLWSAVGLSIACAVGYDHFEELLRGAHQMDRHFAEAPFDQNMPVIMAMISVWYNNFLGAETEAIVPYSQYLSKLVAYLQQGIMESNGKGVDRNGNPIDYQTGTIIWGSTGTNAQHAFFQLIHQGTKLIPTDFIAFVQSLHGQQDHQNKLLANCLAQTEALMMGTYGADPDSPYRVFPGNRPTNTLLIDRLSPQNLGSLIALYEHKLFVQGVVWNIFSYDQWGVELGKKLAKGTLAAIEDPTLGGANSSTQGLLERIRQKGA